MNNTTALPSADISSLLDSLRLDQPHSGEKLRERVADVDANELRREVVRRCDTCDSSELSLFLAILIQIRLGNSAIRLFEKVTDTKADLRSRAVALLLVSTCEPDLIAWRPHAVPDMPKVMKRTLELSIEIARGNSKKAKSPAAEVAPRSTERIAQVKITLDSVEPAVWRRVQLSDSSTLAQLHGVIQAAMGWSGTHLHLFRIGNDVYGRRHAEWPDVKSEKNLTLHDLVITGVKKLVYSYDGNHWSHEIVIEKSLPPDESIEYPVCTSGRRACPPEKCGGPEGYAAFLARAEETLEDVEAFDPHAFDAELVNRRLARLPM